MTYALPALTTLIALLFYFFVTLNVARAHAKYKVDVPAMTGQPDFDRVFRVQMNTLEQLALFLPSMWLFAIYVSLSLIHISEPTRRTPISYAVFCLKIKNYP